ncbi:VOC family protein [Arsenicicoccus piscis]|uniref:3-demethylubiquinone-9 3-methyltransferase n=1 Tax=Arsenicicoccus piscis TaxID=673954 RepID=A0ABQ6HUC4_9MICO|nr:VOC family protein [Arsenicicoccus piscis]MCH8626635.1 VOC family protein [Arsenicicoccus piscis]GMA21293.1 putative 3-demethylubiquinone-9 3-methyltransferase [Arsenicicoccus piscis]
MPDITPCLWFDDDLEQVVGFYTDLFPDSEPGTFQRYGEAGPGQPGTVVSGDWTMLGQRCRGINGGPMFPHTEAFSFSVTCADQAEADHYWDALVADGGEESQCGWLKDRFGLSWQIIPQQLYELMGDPDPRRAQAATQAMLQMRRIDVAALRAAADSASSN